ncbi:MAG: long-chain fatty acid--CoA ligase [Candidatus Marinimicrobia bacterium]|nr:long-chain fatty acid--CoA ligase [Candidatus Neomarinimicrobiota bacterium]
MSTTITYQDKSWLPNYESGVPEHIDYEEVCLPEYLSRTVEKFPNRAALIFQGYKITFSELNTMVNQMAGVLTDFGVKKGDRVAILLPNLIPAVVSYYAIMKIGAITVMNNPLYSDRELEHQFNDSGSTILITLDLLGNRMIDLREKTSIKQIIYTSIGDYLPFPKNILFPLVAKKKKLAADVKPADNVFKWKEVLESATPRTEGAELSIDDPANYQYTGGTTGVSKGVILTHKNMSVQVQQISSWFPQFNPGEEIMLGALPFFHVFGLTCVMNFSIYYGWTNILVPKPQPDQLLEAITKFKPTFAPLVPTMFIGIINHPNIQKVDMTSIKGCFSGSAPLPLEVLQEFEKITGSVIVEGFGLTESSPVTHINPFAGGERKAGSVGIPVSDTECKIVDLENPDIEIPVGEPGELLMKGPQIMKGYYNRPDATAETVQDGWLFTGDIATMDEDGYFYIVDRKKDMIISGGLNVYPREIDEVYYENPKVQEACCIGIPHEKRGEAGKVFIILKKGETATEEEMLEFCQDRLAKFKWPTEVEFRDELPKSTVGKILRKELRADELEKRK